MKFENLYRLVVNSTTLNEADALEDAQELSDDPELGINTDDTEPMSDVGFPAPTETVDPMMLSPDEKVEYLMKNSKILNKNPNWTDNDKRAKAEYIVKNDLFDAFVEPIEARLSGTAEEPEAQAMEELPPDLESDEPTPEDIEDISGPLGAEQELRRREQEDEEEGMPD
jgi:hypothetical protein